MFLSHSNQSHDRKIAEDVLKTKISIPWHITFGLLRTKEEEGVLHAAGGQAISQGGKLVWELRPISVPNYSAKQSMGWVVFERKYYQPRILCL